MRDTTQLVPLPAPMALAVRFREQADAGRCADQVMGLLGIEEAASLAETERALAAALEGSSGGTAAYDPSNADTRQVQVTAPEEFEPDRRFRDHGPSKPRLADTAPRMRQAAAGGRTVR